MIRILSQGIITTNQGLSKLAFNQAGQNVGTGLGEHRGGRVMGLMLRREGAIALRRGFHRQECRMRIERDDWVHFGGELLPGGQTG